MDKVINVHGRGTACVLLPCPEHVSPPAHGKTMLDGCNEGGKGRGMVSWGGQAGMKGREEERGKKIRVTGEEGRKTVTWYSSCQIYYCSDLLSTSSELQVH